MSNSYKSPPPPPNDLDAGHPIHIWEYKYVHYIFDFYKSACKNENSLLGLNTITNQVPVKSLVFRMCL